MPASYTNAITISNICPLPREGIVHGNTANAAQTARLPPAQCSLAAHSSLELRVSASSSTTLHGRRQGFGGKDWEQFGHPKPWKRWRATPRLTWRVKCYVTSASLSHVCPMCTIMLTIVTCWFVRSCVTTAASRSTEVVCVKDGCRRRVRSSSLNGAIQASGRWGRATAVSGCGLLVNAEEAEHLARHCAGRPVRCDCTFVWCVDAHGSIASHRKECQAAVQRSQLASKAHAGSTLPHVLLSLSSSKLSATLFFTLNMNALVVWRCPEPGCGVMVKPKDLSAHRRNSCVPAAQRNELVFRAQTAPRNRTTSTGNGRKPCAVGYQKVTCTVAYRDQHI